MKIITTFFAILVFCLMFVSVSNAQTNNSSNKPQDQPLEIKSKPHPRAVGCQGSGVARVRATFDKSGKVTQAELVLASGCVIFNQNAIEAAKKIKFKPAIKDGEPITVIKLIQYAYQIF